MTNTDRIRQQNPTAVIAYIGLGANLQSPAHQVTTGIQRLGEIAQTRLLSQSSLYCSKPMGPSNQPDYINAVACVETRLEALQLLDALQIIENQQGRTRSGERWGPRTLDLDLLLYNNQCIEHPRLIVPHYGMRQRNFVLLPLAEIEPRLRLPDGQLIQQLLEQIDQLGIQRL